MRTLIHDRVESARAGTNPTVIARMDSGWAVMGDTQFLRGYCLLLADPVVGSINDLDADGRTRFLSDMTAIGDALLQVTDAYRINYEILGNEEPALHAHVFARYMTEDQDLRTGPAWRYPDESKRDTPFDPPTHQGLLSGLYGALFERGAARDAGPLVAAS